MRDFSRRSFLLSCRQIAGASFLGRWFRFLPVAETQAFPLASASEGTDEDSPSAILQTALEGLGGIRRFVRSGQTVAIKANATWAFPPHTGSSTDPEFLRAVIQAVQEAGAGRIIVMDHCSIEPGAEECLRVNGIGALVKEMGVDFVFADRYAFPQSYFTKIELPHGRANQYMRVMKAAVEADVRINLAVAKSHNVAKFSMCLKHMMGFLQFPGSLHADLIQGIPDINTPSAIQADLHILEALRVRMPHGTSYAPAGSETDLTHPEVVSRRNTVIAGTDPVLIDSFGCVHFFDIRPEELAHLLRAQETGCGDMDVEAALSDGRIRRFKAGEPVVEETPTAAQTATGALRSPEPKPTATDLLAFQPPGEPAAPAESTGTEYSSSSRIAALDTLWNYALIPAAAVIAGISLAVLTRLRARLPMHPREGEEEQIPHGGKAAGKKTR